MPPCVGSEIMNVLFLGLTFFALQIVACAQDIFIPFKGRKAIVKIEDPSIKSRNAQDGYIDRLGDRCGDYFFYEQVHDQQILSFAVPTAREEPAGKAAVAIERIGLPLISVQLTSDARVPTAGWRSSEGRIRMIIRMSSEDYEEARCLPTS